MDTKEMIEWLEQLKERLGFYDMSWIEEDNELFVAIIETLQDYDTVKDDYNKLKFKYEYMRLIFPGMNDKARAIETDK